MTLLPTTKTEPSSTPSSSKNVLPDCPLWMRRKRRSSSRRWMIGRKTPARRQRHSLLAQTLLVDQYHTRTGQKLTVGWVDLEVFCTLTETPLLPLLPRLNRSYHQRRTFMMLLRVVGGVLALTLPILHGKVCSMSYWRWVSRKTRLSRMQTSSKHMWSKSRLPMLWPAR
jgi:hypothetical protein